MAEFYVKEWMKEEPNEEVIEKALKEIAYNTRNGDRGSYTLEMIGKIIFWKENDEWMYSWGAKNEFYRPIERIRRITGYLTGTLDRFNDGKKAEERDRVKHTFDSNANIINNRDGHNCSLNDK